MPLLDLHVWNPVFSSKVRKAFWLFSVAYRVSLQVQRTGQICAAWGAHECATSPQSWAAPEIPTRSRACHQKLLQQTEQESVQGDCNHSHPQRVWSIKGIPLSDKNRRLCREVSETDTDLIWEVKPFYSWNCSAALAVLTWADCNCQDCFLLSSHFPKRHYPISMESH